MLLAQMTELLEHGLTEIVFGHLIYFDFRHQERHY
jgi:hypothetical protein